MDNNNNSINSAISIDSDFINSKINKKDFLCPINLSLFYDPVITEDGQTYERYFIEKHFETKETSPLTNKKIGTKLISNLMMKRFIKSAIEDNNEWKKEYMESRSVYYQLNNKNIRDILKEYLSDIEETKKKIVEDYGTIDNWNVSQVTNMRELFKEYKNFNEDISNWNVSNVTNMQHMFDGAKTFNQPLNNWNVFNVKTMKWMFYQASKFNQPLDNWNVSSVKDMGWMFHEAISFNQPLDNWDVSKVTNMDCMFWFADSFYESLNNWDVSNVFNMDYMFNRAYSFNQPLNNWNVSKVTNMKDMF